MTTTIESPEALATVITTDVQTEEYSISHSGIPMSTLIMLLGLVSPTPAALATTEAALQVELRQYASDSSFSQLQLEQVPSEDALLAALQQIHHQLSVESALLDEEASRLLHDNMWDLFA